VNYEFGKPLIRHSAPLKKPGAGFDGEWNRELLDISRIPAFEAVDFENA